jgi:hypothetical protein
MVRRTQAGQYRMENGLMMRDWFIFDQARP